MTVLFSVRFAQSYLVLLQNNRISVKYKPLANTLYYFISFTPSKKARRGGSCSTALQKLVRLLGNGITGPFILSNSDFSSIMHTCITL